MKLKVQFQYVRHETVVDLLHLPSSAHPSRGESGLGQYGSLPGVRGSMRGAQEVGSVAAVEQLLQHAIQRMEEQTGGHQVLTLHCEAWETHKMTTR